MKLIELSRLQTGLYLEKLSNEFFAKYTDIFSVIHFAAPKAEILIPKVLKSRLKESLVVVYNVNRQWFGVTYPEDRQW